MGVDAFSDVLRAVRLKGAVFLDNEMREPFVMEVPDNRILKPLIMPEADHVIEYHVITDGFCFGGIVGEPPIKLERGTIIVFPQGDAHVLSNPAGKRAEVIKEIFLAARYHTPQLPLKYVASGDGAATHIVCGFLGCDSKPFNPLLSALPRMMVVRDELDSPDSRIGLFARMAMMEAADKRPGVESTLSRLAELMFVEAVRRHAAELQGDERDWLAALRDRVVGMAISNLHAKPAQDWTLEELAKTCGVSRTILAERFAEFVGFAPMQYLMRWRMQLAARLLADGDLPIDAVAGRVGYESASAFSRGFKKIVGVSPAAWRSQREAEGAPDGRSDF